MKRFWTDLKHKPFIVYLFVIICLFLFLMMTIYGGSTNPIVLLGFGARSNLHIITGQWWRLLSAAFLHAGFMHLAMNMVFVYYGGAQIEKLIGHWRFLVIYLISAVGGNIVSFAFNQSISVGASTAIAGMLASVIILEQFYPHHLYLKYLAKRYTVLVVINVIFSLFAQNIDHAGHFGGFLSGALITIVLPLPGATNHKRLYRLLAAVALIGVWGFCLYYGYHQTLALTGLFN